MDSFLRTEELHFQCIKIIQDNVEVLQKQVTLLRKYISERKNEIDKEISARNKKNESAAFESNRKFYEYALEKLVKVEQVCEEYLLGMKIDLSTEVRGRLYPPSYTHFPRLRETLPICDTMLSKRENVSKACCCAWKNIAEQLLTDRIILTEKRLTVPTEFDEYDLKFKQDMTVLRAKMFSLPKKRVKLGSGTNLIEDDPQNNLREMKTVREMERTALHPTDCELIKSALKFIEGEFVAFDAWTKSLDIRGKQMQSKWQFVLLPQIRALISKRRIPVLLLDPQTTIEYLSKIPENGIHFFLTKEELIHLVKNKTDVVWLKEWKLQFRTMEGRGFAAKLIQSAWRGYWLRKQIREAERKYIGASIIWFSWISLKKKRQMHERYLTKMLVSLCITKELSYKLTTEFDQLIDAPHTVIHMASLGYPLDIRRTFDPKAFSTYQNKMILRISLARNPKTHVIYVLPVKPTEDLLTMYSDIIESVSFREDVAKRITFVALSEANTFQHRSMNVSRILHCSEQTLEEIRKRIVGTSVYLLPWILDECDVRLAGSLNVPLLSPNMDLQQDLLDASRVTEIINGLSLKQPPHSRNITDYDILCKALAELIVLNTEICFWIIRLNRGLKSKHCGIFLINHISIPFMPILRREREKHGDAWVVYANLRKEFHEKLLKQLPKVVSNVIRLSNVYDSWEKFYHHIQKFGCLVQAVPVEKNSSNISVSLFVPGVATGKKPKWTGIANKVYLESRIYSTFAYLMPSPSLNISNLELDVNKLVEALQQQGYFGYLTIDCCCYPDQYEEKLIVLILGIHPYYSYMQSFIDWIELAIGGCYSSSMNNFTADVAIIPDISKGKSAYMSLLKPPKWNETTDRCALAISHLYHTGFSVYRWSKLKILLENCGIIYDAQKRQGIHLILHDAETKSYAMLTAVSPCTLTTLSMTHAALKNIYQFFIKKVQSKSKTNLPNIINILEKMILECHDFRTDDCI